MILNEFRLVGDFLHGFAILLLVFNIFKTQSCHSVSGMTTILYLITFSCRYLDLYTNYISLPGLLAVYNSIFKIYYLFSNCFILILIYGIFRKTRDKSDDIHPVFVYLICAHILNLSICYFTNYKEIDQEFFWRFSIYLEMLAIIPQLVLTYKQGTINKTMTYYLMMLGSYRAFYILNWIYRYNTESYWEPITFCCGCIQTLIYLYFFLYIYPSLNNANQSHPVEVTKDCGKIVEMEQHSNEKIKQDISLIDNVV